MSILYPILDDFLPDFKVKEDLLNILWEDELECEIELETGKIKVPRDTLLEVVSKSYRQNNYQVGFGNYYGVQVAIGGVKKKNLVSYMQSIALQFSFITESEIS